MIKNILKKILYSTKGYTFSKEININLGYCFHTEQIYNKEIFDTLLSFCKSYFTITSTKPICTVMTPPNPRIMKGMVEYNCSNELYLERVKELSLYAHIGFHGHFWIDQEKFENKKYDIKKNNTNYNLRSLQQQFRSQVSWFKENNITHNNTYAAGWWFINEDILNLLYEEGIKTDYSFSKSVYFQNPYSTNLMNNHNIKCGQPFKTTHNGLDKILHIQNFIGCHNTPFFQDFIRNFNKITDKGYLNLYGVVNSHDYDLNYEYTIMCLKELAMMKNVNFCSHQTMNKKIEADLLKEIII